MTQDRRICITDTIDNKKHTPRCCSNHAVQFDCDVTQSRWNFAKSKISISGEMPWLLPSFPQTAVICIYGVHVISVAMVTTNVFR